jgi:hypothetical protein
MFHVMLCQRRPCEVPLIVDELVHMTAYYAPHRDYGK